MATKRSSPSSRSRTRGAAGSRGRKPAGSSPQAQWFQAMQQVWLAGMGAIARAQKDGPSAFTDAMAEGMKLLTHSRSSAQQRVRDVLEGAQESLQARVDGARGSAMETLDALESMFQVRVQRAMHQLGVPTADEIRVLTKRVAELNETVRQLDVRKRPRKSAPTRARGRKARKSAATAG